MKINNNNKSLNEQVLSREFHAPLNSLTLCELEVFYLEQCRFCISKTTDPFSLTHLVVKQQIQEAIHKYTVYTCRWQFRLLKESSPYRYWPTQPRKGWQHHLDLRPMLFPNSGVSSFRSHKYQISPVGPTVFLTYPEKLQSLTVFRCPYYKGKTFFSLLWVLVGPGFESWHEKLSRADGGNPKAREILITKGHIHLHSNGVAQQHHIYDNRPLNATLFVHSIETNVLSMNFNQEVMIQVIQIQVKTFNSREFL